MQQELIKMKLIHKNTCSPADLRVQRVRRGDVQDRRQLLQPFGRVSAWWDGLDAVSDQQGDRTQFVADVLLHRAKV